MADAGGAYLSRKCGSTQAQKRSSGVSQTGASQIHSCLDAPDDSQYLPAGEIFQVRLAEKSYSLVRLNAHLQESQLLLDC